MNAESMNQQQLGRKENLLDFLGKYKVSFVERDGLEVDKEIEIIRINDKDESIIKDVLEGGHLSSLNESTYKDLLSRKDFYYFAIKDITSGEVLAFAGCERRRASYLNLENNLPESVDCVYLRGGYVPQKHRKEGNVSMLVDFILSHLNQIFILENADQPPIGVTITGSGVANRAQPREESAITELFEDKGFQKIGYSAKHFGPFYLAHTETIKNKYKFQKI